MGNLLNIIAIFFCLFWVIGLFVYNVGAVIHVALVLAVVSLLLRLVEKGETEHHF